MKLEELDKDGTLLGHWVEEPIFDVETTDGFWETPCRKVGGKFDLAENKASESIYRNVSGQWFSKKVWGTVFAVFHFTEAARYNAYLIELPESKVVVEEIVGEETTDG